MRISDWSSDVFSSDLAPHAPLAAQVQAQTHAGGRGAVGPLVLCGQFEFGVVERLAGRIQTCTGGGQFGFRFPRSRIVAPRRLHRSEEHTSELQSLMRISYAVFCLKKKKTKIKKST